VTRDVKGDPETMGGYRVYSAPGGSGYALVADVGNTTRATIENLPRGELYAFTIQAYDAAGNDSALSAPMTLTIP
jgi:hypothetical protein